MGGAGGRGPARASERTLRQELLRFGRLTYEAGLLVALDGNLSVRLRDGLFLCTRTGCHKGLLEDADLLVVDARGRVVRGRGAPTSEMGMHLACYAARPDVEAVLHAHPPVAVALTLAGVSLERCVLPEVVLTLAAIPTLSYRTTGTAALARQVGEAAARHDAMLLERHGAVTLGGSLLEAFSRMETLEHLAKITKAAYDLGALAELDAAEAVRLRDAGLRRYGGPPAALRELDQGRVDLPPACLAPGRRVPPGEPAPGEGHGQPRAERPPGSTAAAPGASALERAIEEAVRATLGPASR